MLFEQKSGVGLVLTTTLTACFTIFFDLSQKLVHHDVESSQESKQESVLRTGSLRADPQKETEFSFLSFDWKKRADEATERTLGSYGSYGS